MTRLQEHWEGARLPGNYALEQWLGGNGGAGHFRSSLADGRRVVVKLMPEGAAGGDAVLDLWHRTRQLRHPNLIELLDCGRAVHDGETVLYAVFEAPDETLASALARSPLSPRESREVLDSILDALRYLHAQGLALGALDAGHVVAVGDRIKLSTGALREAGDPSGYRDDIRMLGGLWRQALMAASPNSEDLASHAADPDPHSRWTLAEIAAALEPEPTAAPPPEPPSPEPPSPEPPPPSPGRRAPDRVGAYAIWRWIIAAAVGVALLIVGVDRPPNSGGTAQSPAPAPSPEAAVPAAPEPAPARDAEVWRLIAFTYHARDAAARQAQRLNRLHPRLHAAVFSPAGKPGDYLVSLGGRMTREEAVRLLRSARRQGLPRDLYVRNYAE